MAKGNSRNKRMKPKDSGRRGKKKISPLASDKVDYVDYKDVDLLRRFISDRAKIRSRRVTGNDSQQQREVARAIKNAREMGLIAYTSRVTTQRRGGRRDDSGGGGRGRPDRDRDRGDRSDRNESAAEEAPVTEVEEFVEVEELVEVEETVEA
jgi:small subunit ribosomal protein S18